jgi:hypothetical protein
MAQLPEPITLPVSGRQVAFRRVKGLDYVEAERIAGDRDSIKYSYAMLARRIQADPPVLMEDVLAMDEDDIAALMGALGPFLAASQPSMPKD